MREAEEKQRKAAERQAAKEARAAAKEAEKHAKKCEKEAALRLKGKGPNAYSACQTVYLDCGFRFCCSEIALAGNGCFSNLKGFR